MFCLGLKIDLDFSMMFGDEVSGKFLAKWPSYFKPKVIAESQSLPSSLYVEELRAAFDPEMEDDYGKYRQFTCIQNIPSCLF